MLKTLKEVRLKAYNAVVMRSNGIIEMIAGNKLTQQEYIAQSQNCAKIK
ncbi:MAG: hypothetical protein NT007_08085 [Candidatus Kapabacteria bacterium]|nr:hypothetical protein [Candidatus Kapabacteria bacterium]